MAGLSYLEFVGTPRRSIVNRVGVLHTEKTRILIDVLIRQFWQPAL
jgi:hypothetical protein